MGATPFGVGLIAAGPVAQAIHLPTLARMPDRFSVVHVADIDPAIAREVAGHVGARCSASAEELIADPFVEVVVVGSPDRFHAEQVIAACEAGKSAVLCEKPLAISVEDAFAIAEASTRTGVPVVVGTMHAFDAAWVEALREWETLGSSAHAIRVSAALPPNAWSEDFATQIFGRPAPRQAAADTMEADVATARGGVLGLAIHDLPLVRRLLPAGPVEVHSVDLLAPWGIELVASVGDCMLELHGAVGSTWRPDWTLEAIGEDSVLRTRFPLSYVHAGSSTSTLTRADQTVVLGPYADGGYVDEWEHVFAVLTGEAAAPDMEALLADADLALDLARQAEALVRERRSA
ncbi:Gfo/Idh/MocA family protein [uncultured Amnibacterium sp.]|uniref:Gfo/Idh/MocA family protein n=1 Tax=uncultured Amnibacterium sp. TaxID=1631851 RepID=UPI0035C9BEF7